MGSLKTNHPLSTSWQWAQIPKKTSDIVSVLKGVHLVRKAVPGVPNKFQVEVSNNRRRGVRAKVTLQGQFTGTTSDTLEGEVRPTETVVLGTFVTEGEVLMDWHWNEL
jgi:hypothetical protein